jgi:hypothetical protein
MMLNDVSFSVLTNSTGIVASRVRKALILVRTPRRIGLLGRDTSVHVGILVMRNLYKITLKVE